MRLNVIQQKKILLIIILIAIYFSLSIKFYLVLGESMEPTLHNLDTGAAVRTTIVSPERFDIAIIEQDNKLLIKRVIGLPGEKVEYQNGILLINDTIIEDAYGVGMTYDFDIQLSENEYFCLGDNREHSSDSRVYGPFNIKDIKAISINKGE